MAVFTAFYPRASPRRHGSHNKNAKTPHRVATAHPSPSSAKKTYSAAITVAEVVHSRPTTRYHIPHDKPLPDPPALDMARSEVVSSPNGDPATADFEGDIKVTDDIPSRSTLDKTAELPVLDIDSNKVPFRSLYQGGNGEKRAQRVMVIFIRHFFCGNCQEYLRTLSASLPSPAELLELPTPTSIVIVGCGSPTLIPMYVEATSCPFPIYADPTKRLYSLLGMARTLSLGSTDPDYIHQTILSGMVKSIVQGLGRMGKGDVFKAGDMRQVGGEFVFENGKVTWCHRMRNTRDHAEAPEMKRVLGLGGGSDDRPAPKRRWTTNLTRLGSTRRPGWNDRKSSVGGRWKSSQSSSSNGSPRRANTMADVSEDEKETSNAGGKQDEKPPLERIVPGEVTKEPDGL